MKNFIKIRIFLWSGLFLVLVFLFWQAIVPGGRITYYQDFSDDNYFIRRLTPVERVTVEPGTAELVGDPVYFSLRTPRTFNTAQVKLKYKNMSELPIFEIGALMDKVTWRYDLKPLENATITKLAEVWDVISEGDLVLLQRERQFNSIDEFLENLPDINEVAVYNYELDQDFVLPDYATSSEELKIEIPIRGTYEFYTYIKDEELDYTFTIQDLNLDKDEEPITLSLFYKNTLLSQETFPDDGILANSGQFSLPRDIGLKLANLPEGVYKLELKTGPDIITLGIKTRQNKLSFINKLDLYRAEGEGILVYTDSTNVQATTIFPESRQTIQVGKNALSLEETYQQYSVAAEKASSTDEFAEIKLERDGVILSGNRNFCFAPEQCLNPSIKRVDRFMEINQEGINYVIADYQGIKYDGEWHIAEAELNLKDAYREKGQYSILLSIPGLKADDAAVDYLELDYIEVKLEGKTLMEKIKEILNL